MAEPVIPTLTPLLVAQLYRPATLGDIGFATTADLPALPGLTDQPRARQAISFGTEIGQRGFNIFAIGANGARMQHAVKLLLQDMAGGRPLPQDWVHVANFTEQHRPVAIALPGGQAPTFQKAVHTLVEDLRLALPATFESEDYQKRRSGIEQAMQAKSEQAFAALNEKAKAKDIVILRTPMGFGMAPIHDGKVVPPAEFNTWPEPAQQAMRDAIAALEKELEETLRALPRAENALRDALRALDRETAEATIGPQFDQLTATYAEIPAVLRHIAAMRADLLDNVPAFISPEAAAQGAMQAAMRLAGPFDRYEVNVFVSQADHAAGGPVIEEPHPTLANLVGRIEYLQVQGALLTNFRLIKSGALHRANGGIILLDARSLLSEPFSWAALKRALLRQEVTIEDVARFVGLTTTVSLEPDPIPLNVKVVLFGDRMLYYLLTAIDPEVAQHFKVLADFDDEVARAPESEAMLARLIGTIAAEEQLRPLDRAAVARAVEHAARLADDANKLTLLVEHMHDLVAEATHLAGRAGRAVIIQPDIDAAIAQRRHRAARVKALSQEMILRDIALIETSGAQVGQINGLSVLTLGDSSFGQPTRITCQVRPGAGRIIDIEREVKLGGPIHSKGVLILSGFLAGRYALQAPMSLYASLVFEQSYGGVEGDSASSAELYCLLSALAGVALRQDLAVTGSVNQHGQVQAIGGANDKIEGFFDICQARGLTGNQGVMIPAANVQHLMLRADVVAACAAGQFAVYPIRNIDEGIALLTGMNAGARGADGHFPEGTLNRLVEDRLVQFAALRKEASAEAKAP